MNRKRTGVLLILVGTLLALAVGAMVYLQSEQAAEIARQTPTTQVVVALVDLPERAAIPAPAVALAKVPADLVPVESATKVESVVGRYPLTRLYKGEVVVLSKLADTGGKSGPSFTLKEGLVAFTLAGNDLLTTTGALRPGDRVDLLLSLPLPRTSTGTTGAQAGANLPMVSQTLVQNIEVLRVGSFLAAQPEGAVGKGITFQVSHQDALALKWAKDSGGTIDLVLRRPSDKEPASTEAVTANYIFRKYGYTIAEPVQ